MYNQTNNYASGPGLPELSTYAKAPGTLPISAKKFVSPGAFYILGGNSMETKKCEQCGYEVFEESDKFCSDYCEGMATYDRDEHQEFHSAEVAQ